MLWAYTIYSAALTPVVLAAFYSKRVTAWGAVAAIGTGTVVTLAWDLPYRLAKGYWEQINGKPPVFHPDLWIPLRTHLLPKILSDRDAIFPALIAAVAALIVVSLFTTKPMPEQLAQFAG
jgi:SSS family solute:Na+ symporter/sodium/proline symporter